MCIRDSVETARSSYSEILGNVSILLSDYKAKMSQCMESQADIQEHITQFGSDYLAYNQNKSANEERLRNVKNRISDMERVR